MLCVFANVAANICVCVLFVLYCVMLHGLFTWASFAGCVCVVV